MKNRVCSVRALAVIGALALAGCGGGSDGNTTSGSGDSSVAIGGFNDADVEFAQGMVAHHEQAIEMSEAALDPATASGASVRQLAQRISDAQGGEITLMTGWLKSWNMTVGMDTSNGHEMSDMEGMMTADEMKQLEAATGPEFDKLWLTMMIAHHKGAVSQSKAAQKDGSFAELKSLAGRIIAAQESEIAEMEQLLGT
jgi:uncharacterized protein (DUF305 family)